MSRPEVWHGVQRPPADPPAPIGDRVRRKKILLDPADSHWDREVTLDLKAGPYTYTNYNRDELRRLVRAMRLLEQLLKRSSDVDLPALTWTITTGASLVGELSTIGGPDPAGVREAFMAWVQELELDRREVGQSDGPARWWTERQCDGQVELRGARMMTPPIDTHLEVSVSIRAFWWTHEEDAEPAILPTITPGQPE